MKKQSTDQNKEDVIDGAQPHPNVVEELEAERESLKREIAELKVAQEQQEKLRCEWEACAQERTAALHQSNLRLQRSNEELQQLAYVASHDLQTPLRGITSFSQLLERDYKDQLDDRGGDFIFRIARAAKRMQTLIEDLLKFSRVESHAEEHVRVNLNDAVAISVERLEDEIERTGAQIQAAELPFVFGDSQQLAHVFQNLIENAIKYTGDGIPQITISSETVGEHEQVSVADQGIGIELDQRGRIFEVFKRLHGNDEYSGNGIGLAICKRIIERHGGRIWVEANEPRGCCFRFTLPCSVTD